eukprot:1371069-Alexandrium_andersonii.AAC.1
MGGRAAPAPRKSNIAIFDQRVLQSTGCSDPCTRCCCRAVLEGHNHRDNSACRAFGVHAAKRA